MPVTKECRCCTMPLVFPAGMAVQACPACRALNERPQAEGIMLDNFRRAICQQADRDFYNAEKSYQYVLNSCPDNAEALWGRLLCHYGAVCVAEKDKRLWEIHMTGSTPLQEQGDFRRACQLAAPDVSAQYAEDAAYIDSAMARIRELAEKCPPYDVFLCHKTTTESGGYTEDYNRAYALYNLLTKKGYRVFFAPVEMEGVTAGEDYEAAIYHALDTARVMLVICSSPQHLTSLWVQSEWKRYLEKIDGGQDKHLIPLLYGGLTAEELPQEFRYRRLQALTMELGATEKVLSAVRQYVKPKGKPWRAVLAMAIVLVMLAGAGAAYLAGRGALPTMGRALPTESTGMLTTTEPTDAPPAEPTAEPTAMPTTEPTATPTTEPTATPTTEPTAEPTATPTTEPTAEPTATPTTEPTAEPTATPTTTPTEAPTTPTATPAAQAASIVVNYLDMRGDLLATVETVLPGGDGRHVITPDPAVIPAGYGVVAGLDSVTVTVQNGRASQQVVSFYVEQTAGVQPERAFDVVIHYYDTLGNEIAPGQTVRLEPGDHLIEAPAEAPAEGYVLVSEESLMLTVYEDGSLSFPAQDVAFWYHQAPTPTAAPEKQLQSGTITMNGCEVGFRPATDGGYEISSWTGGTDIVIPSTINGVEVTAVGDRAFFARTDVTSVSIPAGVKTIGTHAFFGCSALTAVALPEGLTDIGDYAFDGCTALADVNFPRTLRTIGSSAFGGCTSLEAAVIPEGVHTIGYYAFGGCTALARIEIPDSVTTIGNDAFRGCPGAE